MNTKEKQFMLYRSQCPLFSSRYGATCNITARWETEERECRYNMCPIMYWMSKKEA